jgi:hypothetical protein
MRLAVVLLAVLLCGCGDGGGGGAVAERSPRASVQPELVTEIDGELAAIRADPGESVGFGEKSYVPYEPNVAHALITVPDPEVTARLRREILGARDPVYALALLHVLGRRTDAGVDDVLLETLEDPRLTATSAYLLGRPGFKPYPARDGGDAAAIEAALRRHLHDEGTFEDPFYRQSFRIQDFVIAALVRLRGPSHFHFERPDLGDNIGYDLPDLGPDRAGLLAQL